MRDVDVGAAVPAGTIPKELGVLTALTHFKRFSSQLRGECVARQKRIGHTRGSLVRSVTSFRQYSWEGNW